MKRTLASALVLVGLLFLGGCAGYYSDRYYYSDYYDHYDRDGYYYEDGYHPRARYARRYRVADPYYYDLYDPYLTLFSPFGWIYDPWFHRNYHFGVQLYPYRHFGFSFYGGRPWFYSPWYSGYGLYYPYGWWAPRGYQHAHGRSSTSRDQMAGGPSAAQAVRGLAAGMPRAESAMTAFQPGSLVRSSAIAGSAHDSADRTLLGTMSIPTGELGNSGSVRLSRMGTAAADLPTEIGAAEQEPRYGRESMSGNAGFSSRQQAWEGRAAADTVIPLGRGGFPLAAGDSAGTANLQSIDDDHARSVMDRRDQQLQRWQSTGEPRLQRWQGSASMPAAPLPMSEPRLRRNTESGMGWNGGRDLRRAEPAPSWQGRGDFGRGNSGFSPPMQRSAPTDHGFSSPRMDRGSESSGRGNHSRNDHEQ